MPLVSCSASVPVLTAQVSAATFLRGESLLVFPDQVAIFILREAKPAGLEKLDGLNASQWEIPQAMEKADHVSLDAILEWTGHAQVLVALECHYSRI
jgi:hypothetical protein